MKNELIEDFRQLLRMFEREIGKINSSNSCYAVTQAQCHALIEVNLEGGISLNDLSKKLALDKSSVSRTVENLTKKNLINRTIPESNRRMVELNVSDEGGALCNKINNENNSYFKEVFKNISDQKLNIFLEVFKIITMNMNQLNHEKL
ncbi:MAG: MarR family transcriptional regulator [Salinivirgaceae bacterium]|jgi:DNA-binding MarR family transcriptional regulator|nr:MarR family transcriptional regulator [Salinivirgaceae bacterium]